MPLVYLACMELPALLIEAFDGDRDLLAWAGTLRPSWQREIGKWIMEPKGEAARVRRAEQLAERLLETMEAEIELPPLIETAFRARPKARAGWAKMTPTQRREELLGVFYYRTPEARQRRVETLCETAEKRA
jgi:uncharacterized protein YdeI (YjbR/CyaY-like superfamily)